MNRIKISPLAVSSPSEPIPESKDLALEQIEKLTVTPGDECSVFVPVHYEPNYRYPLIVWLHANGDDRSQLQRVLPSTSIRNYVGIAPESPYGDPDNGFQWLQTESGIEAAHDTIATAIDHATMRFNVAPDRIFLAGFGAGGQMAFRIAFDRPELFAGVLSLNGALPASRAPLAGWQECRDLPVFWAHCRSSREFEERQLCEQLKLLHVAGFSVTLRQYPGCDRLIENMLADMNNWIMEMIESSIGTRRQ